MERFISAKRLSQFPLHSSLKRKKKNKKINLKKKINKIKNNNKKIKNLNNKLKRKKLQQNPKRRKKPGKIFYQPLILISMITRLSLLMPLIREKLSNNSGLSGNLKDFHYGLCTIRNMKGKVYNFLTLII